MWLFDIFWKKRKEKDFVIDVGRFKKLEEKEVVEGQKEAETSAETSFFANFAEAGKMRENLHYNKDNFNDTRALRRKIKDLTERIELLERKIRRLEEKS